MKTKSDTLIANYFLEMSSKKAFKNKYIRLSTPKKELGKIGIYINGTKNIAMVYFFHLK